MTIDLGYRRRIEGYRPGMGSRETVTVVSPRGRMEITLGGLLAQMPLLELPDADAVSPPTGQSGRR